MASTMEEVQVATLAIRGLRAEVEGKEILRGIDLDVKQGEVHAIMGPNGSGKSTLANVIMGRPGYVGTAGEIRFRGQDITGAHAGPARPARPVPRVPVPDGDPRRIGGELPAVRVQGGEGRADLAPSRSASA